MSLLKLAFSALTLELSSLASLALGARSDEVLLVYLVGHAIASALLAMYVTPLLPESLRKPYWPTMVLLSGIGFSVPILGFVAVGTIVPLLPYLKPRQLRPNFGAIVMPDIDPHQRAGAGFRQAGMRSFIANTRAPVTTRLRALVALQNISGHVASPLLRDVLADPSEDIRLLAYGMLDQKEKMLNDAIHADMTHFRQATPDSPEWAACARRLADRYWELIYQKLAQGDLRTYAVDRSLHYLELAMTVHTDDPALHLRRGRLLESMGCPEKASDAYNRALAAGMPKTRIVPYLAEVAYDLGRYDEVHQLMNEFGEWQSLPRLKPVIDYWSRK